jgi:hypothetical protein
MNSTFSIKTAYVKRKINNITDPTKNHPIHDSGTVFFYDKEKFYISVVFDGVSESKGIEKGTVNISREIEWDLEAFCRREKPDKIKQISNWFQEAVKDKKYDGLGATTISLIRFNTENGKIDGITVGDSPAAICKQISKNGEPFFETQILSAFHVVANDPGIITRQWKYGQPLELTVFELDLPTEFEAIYLVNISDGYGKLSDEDTMSFIDDDLQDREVSLNYPYFSDIYIPQIALDKFTEIKRNPEGATKFISIKNNEKLNNYLAEIYNQMSDDEKSKMSTVDLDTGALLAFFRDHKRYIESTEFNLQDVFDNSHIALRWMLEAPYNESKDEQGLDDYLREYIIAKIFILSMLEELWAYDQNLTLQKQLSTFTDSLDPISDDFSVSIIKIVKNNK